MIPERIIFVSRGTTVISFHPTYNKANRIGQTLRRSPVLKHVTDGKTEGKWIRRCKQLLDDLTENTEKEKHETGSTIERRNGRGCSDKQNSYYYHHHHHHHHRGTAVAQWLRCCAKNWKVSGSIPDGVIGIHRTMALGLTKSLIEISTMSISWG